MNRLSGRFHDLSGNGQRVLLPYITAGFPDYDTTIEILRRVPADRCGAVELGIPFSDPIADGPTIEASFSAALAGGFKLGELLDRLRDARREIPVPLIAMVSYSIVYRREPAKFVREARSAGFDGLLVPDLSIEQANTLADICRGEDCPLVMMIAPTTRPDRRDAIADLSEPFIYYQSVVGITGERNTLPTELAVHVRRLREQARKPVCVGFGIGKPEQVRAVCEFADGAIVGSAIVRRLLDAHARGEGSGATTEAALKFINELAAALPPKS